MVETRRSDVGRLAWLPSRKVSAWVVLGLWLVAAAVSTGPAGKLTSAQENDNAAWLPEGAESTEVLERMAAFQSPDEIPALVVFERDGGVCQYSGEYVGKGGGNLDHVIPRDRGGRDSFENLVWAKREINSRKANRLPHEAGLKLVRRPKAPLPLPAAATIREVKHPDWRHFLTS